MFAIAAAACRYCFSDLMDDVWVEKEDFIVRLGKKTTRFPIRNVIEASASVWSTPQVIVLKLESPCLFGDEISFLPEWPRYFSTHPVIELVRQARESDGK